MVLTPGKPHPVPVEIVCAAAQPPICISGSLTALVSRRCTLQSQAPLPDLRPGTSVVVRLQDRHAMELIGQVESQTDQKLDVSIVRVSPREKRYFPREDGGIDMHWKRLERSGSEVATHAWRRGLFEVDGNEDWNTPEPFMNFSASGLRFRDLAPCSEGDIVLIAFRLQGRTAWHRATAVVVRRDQPENGACPEIAVAFQDLEPETVQLLADYTLDRQLDELAKHAPARSDSPP